jgi:hypothetical protein
MYLFHHFDIAYASRPIQYDSGYKLETAEGMYFPVVNYAGFERALSTEGIQTPISLFKSILSNVISKFLFLG